MKKTSRQRREQRNRAKMRATEITEGTVNKVLDLLIDHDLTPDIIPYIMGEKKKENNMSNAYVTTQINTNSRPTETEQQRQYFLSRLHDLTHEKDSAAEIHFGIRDDKAPKTPNELVKRIKDGKFVIHKDCEDLEAGRYSWEYFTWRDPEVKKDRDGYKVAFDLIQKAGSEAEDEIWNDPKNALTAIQKFEAKTFY